MKDTIDWAWKQIQGSVWVGREWLKGWMAVSTKHYPLSLALANGYYGRGITEKNTIKSVIYPFFTPKARPIFVSYKNN